MISLLKKLALLEPVSGDMVVLSSINDGVDGASVFFYSQERGDLVIEDGQTVLLDLNHNFDVRVLRDSTEYTTMKGWSDNLTKVRATALGIDGEVIQEEPVLLVLNQQFTNADVLALMMTLKAVPGYTGGVSNGTSSGDNLLRIRDVRSGDGDFIHGFSAVGTITQSEANGVQTVNTAAASSGVRFVKLFDPYPGTNRRARVTVSSVTGDWSLVIRALDDTETLISAMSEGFNATGDISVDFQLPADTVWVEYEISQEGSAGTEVVFTAPKLEVF